MKAGQAELLAALRAAGWGTLPWSGEDANRGALRVELEGGYTLEARCHASVRPQVSLAGGGNERDVSSPAMALQVVEKWERQHAERALAASNVADELRAMIGGAKWPTTSFAPMAR